MLALGCPNIERLVRTWAMVSRNDTYKPRARELRRLQGRLDLIQLWERICRKDGPYREEVELLRRSDGFQRFLDEAGLRGRKGVTRQSQLTSYLTQRLGLTSNKIFSNTIARYWPVSILVTCLGDGVIAFLPYTGLLRHLRLLRIKTAPSAGPAGARASARQAEAVFQRVIEGLLREFPVAKDLCRLAQESVVEPILRGRSLPCTAGQDLLEEGRRREFASIGVWNLVEAGGAGAEMTDWVEELPSLTLTTTVTNEEDDDERDDGGDGEGGGEGGDEGGGDEGGD